MSEMALNPICDDSLQINKGDGQKDNKHDSFLINQRKQWTIRSLKLCIHCNGSDVRIINHTLFRIIAELEDVND